MGALAGLALGVGLLLVLFAVTGGPPAPASTLRRSPTRRLDDLLAEAGMSEVRPLRLVLASFGVAGFAAVVMLAVSGSVAVACSFGAMAGYAPLALVRYRRRQRQHELRELWPDVVDNLASAVHAGLSLPEALTQVGERGPEPLRPAFRQFAADYRATGRFDQCLDRLKAELADPVGDRIVETLRLARQVGGTHLGRLLRTLSGFLRDDARTRAELESRQTWTVNAARLAVAAPWVLLAFLSLRPEAVRSYDSTAGAVVLAFGAGVSFVAYRLMLRLGRLPHEERVLR